MALSFPPIGSLSLSSPLVTSPPPVSGSNFLASYQSLSIARHFYTPSDLLGQPILPSSNVVSTFTTSGPSTSGLFLLSLNQPRNPSMLPQITQSIPLSIQVVSSLIPLTGGKRPFSRQNPSMVPTLVMGHTQQSWGQPPPSFGGQPQPFVNQPNPLWGLPSSSGGQPVPYARKPQLIWGLS